MTFVDDLEETIVDYLDGDYEIDEIDTIPSIDDVPFGKYAKKASLCAYCIDIRGSTELLDIHQKQTCGKIHKAFLAIASKVVLKFGGSIRSFNGDGLLAFWPIVHTEDFTPAINAALVTKYLIDERFSPNFEEYSKIDFGIGIDWGDVYILRAGLPRDINNNDLVFIGKCVNYATAIANQAEGPYHVEISESVYDNLEDDSIYEKKEGKRVNIWKDGVVKWKGEEYNSKITSWYLPVD